MSTQTIPSVPATFTLNVDDGIATEDVAFAIPAGITVTGVSWEIKGSWTDVSPGFAGALSIGTPGSGAHTVNFPSTTNTSPFDYTEAGSGSQSTDTEAAVGANLSAVVTGAAPGLSASVSVTALTLTITYTTNVVTDGSVGAGGTGSFGVFLRVPDITDTSF